MKQAGDPEREWRPKRTQPDFAKFIEAEKDALDRWYLDEFGERRAPGRQRIGEVRKAFDYPSPSALRDWVRIYQQAGCRVEAFRPGYKRCGNRSQIDPRALPVIDAAVRQYCSVLRPTIGDIYENVDEELQRLNKQRIGKPIYVSERAVRRQIHKIDPFVRDFSRRGPDYAMRKYTPVGKGLSISEPLERVEMDDWDVDLHTLIAKSSVWKELTKAQKAMVPRTRITATVAIDCMTRSIVGFNCTPYSPSAATAKSTLRSAMIDKTPMAKWAGAQSDWPMYGRIGHVATDGGPVFRGEFEEALRKSTVARTLPDQDPRMRGTIESFFRTFQRLCRYFAGRAFKDVVDRGDYPSEKMAVLTFQEFYKLAIVFIVDKYHHSKHRGLEGGTPHGMWTRLASKGLPPPISDEQRFLAFGFPIDRNVDAHGIAVHRLRYNSQELGKLYGFVGDQELAVTIDPDDMGAILVRIPDRHLGRILPEDQRYLKVPCVEGNGKDVTLVALLEGIDEVKKIVREQQEAGRPFRLASHRYLLDAADKAIKEGLAPSHEMTEKQHRLIDQAIGHKARAAMSDVGYAKTPLAADSMPGRVVAKAQRTRPSGPDLDTPSGNAPTRQRSKPTIQPPNGNDTKPFGGGMNLYGEDE